MKFKVSSQNGIKPWKKVKGGSRSHPEDTSEGSNCKSITDNQTSQIPGQARDDIKRNEQKPLHTNPQPIQ
ncbi:MAG: hypothetical protein ED557_10025 [Balneola sp.]|nr:MAG: hypothetical protein ED557_10025 [Balneola sp.]